MKSHETILQQDLPKLSPHWWYSILFRSPSLVGWYSQYIGRNRKRLINHYNSRIFQSSPWPKNSQWLRNCSWVLFVDYHYDGQDDARWVIWLSELYCYPMVTYKGSDSEVWVSIFLILHEGASWSYELSFPTTDTVVTWRNHHWIPLSSH